MLKLFCCLFTWLIFSFACWKFWQTLREGVVYVKRLHQIPCSRCQFFTGDYRLKCTVHPASALSEEAIGCRDFEPTHSVPQLAPHSRLAKN